MVVSLAGPLTGFAAGAVAIWLYRSVGTDSELVHSALSDLIFVTIGVGRVQPAADPPPRRRGGDGLGPGAGHRAAAASGRPGWSRWWRRPALAVVGILVEEPFVAMIAAFFGFQNWQALAGARDEPDLRRLREGRAALLRGRRRPGRRGGRRR